MATPIGQPQQQQQLQQQVIHPIPGVPLTHAALATLPPHLQSHLGSWPPLATLPLDGAILHRAGALSRLQELEKEIVQWLQSMQLRAQQMKTQPPSPANPPLTQQDAQTYSTLHTILGAIQTKSREVESAMQRASAGQPAAFLDEEQEPGQQQQQPPQRQTSNVEMTDGATPAQTPNQQQQPQQQPNQHQQQFQQQQQPAAAATPSTALQPASTTPAAAPSPTADSSMMHWILPPERRKLPGTRYQKIRTLRKTLFGKVALYFDTLTQKRVAIKLSNKELLLEGKTTTGNRVAENPLEELRFLRILSRNNEADGSSSSSGGQQQQQFIHPGQNHVMQLLDEAEDEENLWSILEFCAKGEFFDIVCAANRFDEPRAKLYFIQLAQGVAYLHAHLICHLDLSLENMLMDENDVCKICDFGVARMMTLDANRHLVAYPAIKQNKPGKIGYMAPELFAGHSFYGHLCDIWAMGIILFISLTGVPPYQLPAISDQRFKLIYEGNLGKLLAAWGMTNIMSPAAKDIISRMLCPPEKRMNIQQVLQHPFVTGQV